MSMVAKLRNIIVFTIGGTKGIEILERLTEEIREYWPDFEGFITVFYEGIFATYQDKGVSGINLPDVDFYWKGGIVAPEFRRQTLSMCNPLFEKCIIYDGGARRYEIHEHVEEVLEFWNGMLERADQIDLKELLDEKLGYPAPFVIRCLGGSKPLSTIKRCTEKLAVSSGTWLHRELKRNDCARDRRTENRRNYNSIKKIYAIINLSNSCIIRLLAGDIMQLF